jgi:hypothetical protein
MTGGRDGRVKFWDTTDLTDTTEPLKIFDLASLTPDRAIPAIRSVCFDGYLPVPRQSPSLGRTESHGPVGCAPVSHARAVVLSAVSNMRA